MGYLRCVVSYKSPATPVRISHFVCGEVIKGVGGSRGKKARYRTFFSIIEGTAVVIQPPQ